MLNDSRFPGCAGLMVNKTFWHRQSVTLFVYEISWELLNRFVPNSHGKHVWSLARTSLKVRVKGQGHRDKKTAFSAAYGSCLVKHL